MRLAGGALPVPALHASAHHDASPPSPQVAGGALPAGELPRDALPALYSLGLVRYDVPVAACDRIAVPPLKGFVMNRVGHDYLEKMLYEVIPVPYRPELCVQKGCCMQALTTAPYPLPTGLRVQRRGHDRWGGSVAAGPLAACKCSPRRHTSFPTGGVAAGPATPSHPARRLDRVLAWLRCQAHRAAAQLAAASPADGSHDGEHTRWVREWSGAKAARGASVACLVASPRGRRGRLQISGRYRGRRRRHA